MPSTIAKLADEKLFIPPAWLPSNIILEVIMGSTAYGVSCDTSDMDIYGVCIPPKEIIFPHLAGEILDFDTPKNRFHTYQKHNIFSQKELGGKGRNYDLNIYSIVKYFSLLMKNNPNMLDLLFAPTECILYINQIGQKILSNRTVFIHKGCYHQMIGYAYSQLHTMHKNQAKEGTSRFEYYVKYGFDTKSAMHLVRLVYECEQILIDGTMDLRKHKEHLKAIRNGEVAKNDILSWFYEKEKTLEVLYRDSKLPHGPNVDQIKSILLECLEHHYGSLSSTIVVPSKLKQTLIDIKNKIEALNI